MKISIVTPTKNSEKYILETLESIHSQGYPDLEHIIVDGCSTDRTVDIINEFIDQKKCDNIRLLVKADKNMYEAINTGLKMITGDIYAYLNSDDCYCNRTFEVINELFESRKDIDMMYGNCHYVDDKGATLFWSNNPSFNFKRLVRTGTGWLQQPGTFFSKRVLDNVGYFDTAYALAADYDYLLRVGESCNVLGIENVVVKFRVHSKSISMTRTGALFEEAKAIRRKYENTKSIMTVLLTLSDYAVIYGLLIRPNNFRYMIKKLIGSVFK